MRPLIDYIQKNKEWIFSGIGVLVISLLVGLFRWLLARNSPSAKSTARASDGKPENSSPLRSSLNKSNKDGSPHVMDVPPPEWQAILPEHSKYVVMTKTMDLLPLGLQLFTFEYGPSGHAKSLILRNKVVRAEIQFTCRIENPYKAAYAANDYALNVLQPKFLTLARGILESYTLSKLRGNRQEVSREILNSLLPHFEELGVRLESVTIGSIEPVES